MRERAAREGLFPSARRIDASTTYDAFNRRRDYRAEVRGLAAGFFAAGFLAEALVFFTAFAGALAFGALFFAPLRLDAPDFAVDAFAPEVFLAADFAEPFRVEADFDEAAGRADLDFADALVLDNAILPSSVEHYR